MTPDAAWKGAEAASSFADPRFLESLRTQMVKFAVLQLQDADLAEDAVQEAMMGALKNAQSFAGEAAFKTWVFAILKNKIIDALRQRQRMSAAVALLEHGEENEDSPALFDKRGFWKPEERPQYWADPEASFERNEFWQVFESCLDKLPAKQGRIFMMREFIELSSAEMCASLGISGSNLHVILHRARLRLRECLENHWFTGRA